MRIPIILILGYILVTAPSPVRDFNLIRSNCTDCHGVMVDEEYIHAPALDACENCHESTGAGHPLEAVPGFVLVEEVPGLCYICHDILDNQAHVHYPVMEGECLGCHNVHDGSHTSLVKEEPVAALCFYCHDKEVQNHSNLHEPVKQGHCEHCHNTHQSENSALLRDAQPVLCFSCHEQMRNVYQLTNTHSPFTEACATCHMPHGWSPIPTIAISLFFI